MIAYISGHLDLKVEEFDEHYGPQITEACQRGDSFVVGDARGADMMALQSLLSRRPVSVTLYHMLENPRTSRNVLMSIADLLNLKIIGGFQSDEERDAAMTAASDYDIAWVRPGREKSGTAKNLARRIKKDTQ